MHKLKNLTNLKARFYKNDKRNNKRFVWMVESLFVRLCLDLQLSSSSTIISSNNVLYNDYIRILQKSVLFDCILCLLVLMADFNEKN